MESIDPFFGKEFLDTLKLQMKHYEIRKIKKLIEFEKIILQQGQLKTFWCPPHEKYIISTELNKFISKNELTGTMESLQENLQMQMTMMKHIDEFNISSRNKRGTNNHIAQRLHNWKAEMQNIRIMNKEITSKLLDDPHFQRLISGDKNLEEAHRILSTLIQSINENTQINFSMTKNYEETIKTLSEDILQSEMLSQTAQSEINELENNLAKQSNEFKKCENLRASYEDELNAWKHKSSSPEHLAYIENEFKIPTMDKFNEIAKQRILEIQARTKSKKIITAGAGVKIFYKDLKNKKPNRKPSTSSYNENNKNIESLKDKIPNQPNKIIPAKIAKKRKSIVAKCNDSEVVLKKKRTSFENAKLSVPKIVKSSDIQSHSRPLSCKGKKQENNLGTSINEETSKYNVPIDFNQEFLDTSEEENETDVIKNSESITLDTNSLSDSDESNKDFLLNFKTNFTNNDFTMESIQKSNDRQDDNVFSLMNVATNNEEDNSNDGYSFFN